MWHAEFSSGAKSKKSLIYSSKDGTLFALNAIRLTCCAPGLPRVPPSPSPPTKAEAPPTNDRNGGATSPTRHPAPNTSREPIPLPESSKALSVLFQFILPKPPPTLQDLDVEELFEVLKTARKYKVYTIVSIGESRLLSLADDSDAGILFLYGITNKLPRFMDPGAPAAYRNIKREELLEPCNEHGVLHAWTRYQLLWDRIIEEACNVAISSTPHNRKGKEIHNHYNNLPSLQWERNWTIANNPEDRTLALESEGPKVSYDQFLAMLDEDTLTLAVDSPVRSSHPDPSLERVSVKHVNDKVQEMIKKVPTFSSFLESDKKDGDIVFEREGLDSSEEEREEKQDGSG